MSRNEQEVLSQNINRICHGTEIIGSINASGDMRIDGVLEGNLMSKGRVVIGESGRIKGDLICKNVDIWGSFEGKITASESTNFKAMAVVIGEIKSSKLYIEAGAKFNGSCTMPAEQQPTKLS
ncbi:MAG: polymer-forming cytoskeletal protein [Prevotellaceae bacterium]|jgi:cytoskeletal protein CcmA (bactofilin family)|nr:polymer-forming cytoskeletal protein [Prevotellaceae bacterium]